MEFEEGETEGEEHRYQSRDRKPFSSLTIEDRIPISLLLSLHWWLILLLH